MYGFGSPGGIVNYVTKKPSDTPVRSIDIGYKSNSLWSEHVDLGGRVGSDDRFGYRLNATHEEGKTFNDGCLRRDSLSLSLDARLTQDLSWDFDALYQHRRSTGQTPSISTSRNVGSSLPSVISGANQELLGAGQHLTNTLQLYSTGLQYRLAPDWTLSAGYSHSTATRSRNEGILYLTDISGDYDDYRSDTREGHRFDQAQALLQGKLRTGAFDHQLVLGLTLSADAKYTGTTLLNASNGLKLPGYALANIGAGYTTRIKGHATTWRAAINNLANRRYWEFQYDNYIKPGDPRTVSVSAELEF